MTCNTQSLIISFLLYALLTRTVAFIGGCLPILAHHLIAFIHVITRITLSISPQTRLSDFAEIYVIGSI